MPKSRTYVIVRDDDICYFTESWELERVHRPLLEEGKPINIAVIPLVDSKLNEPFVKRHVQDLRYLPVELNRDLVEFIKQHNFEILQHGLTHSVFTRYPRLIHEFSLKNKSILIKRALTGIKMLSTVFSRPRFFVPPWDSLSKEGYEVLSKLYQGVLLASMSHSGSGLKQFLLQFLPRNLPSRFIPFFIICRAKIQNYCLVNNRFLVIEHRGLELSPKTKDTIFEIIKKIVLRYRIVVILVHYWVLIRDTALLALWHRLLDVLLDMPNIHFVRVSEIFKIVTEMGSM